uniref:Uncharacterized protein n=1 Tax=Knipowitschia caucasica TaxID=637954 RepID=A0AAV2LMS1_KNICA
MFSEANMIKVEKVYPSCLDDCSSTEETPLLRSRKPAARQRRRRHQRLVRAAAGEVTHSSLLTKKPVIGEQPSVEMRLRLPFPRFLYHGRRALGRKRMETRERSRSPHPPPFADEVEWPPLVASMSPIPVTSQSPVMSTPEILEENVNKAISPAVLSRCFQHQEETASLEKGRPGLPDSSLAPMDSEVVAHGSDLAKVITPNCVTTQDTCLENDQDMLDAVGFNSYGTNYMK